MPKARCDVCWSDLPLDQFRVLPCGHCFCAVCTTEFTKPDFPTCPKCRRLIIKSPFSSDYTVGRAFYITIVDDNSADPDTSSPELDASPSAAATVAGHVENVRKELDELELEVTYETVQRAGTEIAKELADLESECEPLGPWVNVLTTFRECLMLLFTTLQTQISALDALEDELSAAESQRDAFLEQFRSSALFTTVQALRVDVRALEARLVDAVSERDAARADVEAARALPTTIDALKIEVRTLTSALETAESARNAALAEQEKLRGLPAAVGSLTTRTRTLEGELAASESARQTTVRQLQSYAATAHALRLRIQTLETDLSAARKVAAAEQEKARVEPGLVDRLRGRVRQLEEDMSVLEAERDTLQGQMRSAPSLTMSHSLRSRVQQLESQLSASEAKRSAASHQARDLYEAERMWKGRAQSAESKLAAANENVRAVLNAERESARNTIAGLRAEVRRLEQERAPPKVSSVASVRTPERYHAPRDSRSSSIRRGG